MRAIRLMFILVLATVWSGSARAADVAKIDYVEETLPNGLRVIYAPLHNAPVVHVRVVYHVGSRDEEANHQGFAHMFEHMMFRGSAHVAPQEHMRLIQAVGGISNAFTSFDQTTYHQTLPSNNLSLALYLEADRMSSFHVSPEIYATERRVVGEEWGRGINQPYGSLFQDFMKLAFKESHYQWTPIGNMEHLAKAPVEDLQDFFNKYYVPNNAVLVVAGDIDVDAAKPIVKKYFGWIPKGEEFKRLSPAEPKQTEARRLDEKAAVPLAAVVVGYHMPGWASDDRFALDVIQEALGDGAASELSQALVNSADPLCVSASASSESLEDAGIMVIEAMALQGKNPADVEKRVRETIAKFVEKGIDDKTLSEIKNRLRIGIIRSRQTAEQIATDLGEEATFGGDAARVNTAIAKIDALTAADILAAAKKYLAPENSDTLVMTPDMSMVANGPKAANWGEVAKSTRGINFKKVDFPGDYPQKPQVNEEVIKPKFNHGQTTEIDGVKVIILSDSRLPLVNWRLTMRQGGDCEAPGKEGVAGLTAQMMERGAAGISYLDISRDLDARGINIGVDDGGDVTRVGGSCTTDQLDYAIGKTNDILTKPNFDAGEFAKLKQQAASALASQMQRPDYLAEVQLDKVLYGQTRQGRHSTIGQLMTLTLDDVKGFYGRLYHSNDAILTISGDVTPEKAQELARKLLAGLKPAEALPAADYKLPAAPTARQIIVVDRPAGRQSMIRMRTRAYPLSSDDKYAGSIAGTLLSNGIDSRLGRYVRAEKGLVYSVYGIFRPGRHSGVFVGATETSQSTADTIQAMFKVFNDMRTEAVSDADLADAKLRITGSMVLSMQSISQQADMRADILLNGYPEDYYEQYPAKIAAVTADQVKEVLNKYAQDNQFVVVVVAPAKPILEQLEKIGPVQVVDPSAVDGAPMQMP